MKVSLSSTKLDESLSSAKSATGCCFTHDPARLALRDLGTAHRHIPLGCPEVNGEVRVRVALSSAGASAGIRRAPNATGADIRLSQGGIEETITHVPSLR